VGLHAEKTTQWRFTPPTHVVAAFDSAIAQYLEEGGLAARGARYAHNCGTLIDGMAKLGLKTFLPAAIQAPIIVTFYAPDSPHYSFKTFYDAVKGARLRPVSWQADDAGNVSVSAAWASLGRGAAWPAAVEAVGKVAGGDARRGLNRPWVIVTCVASK